LAHCISHKIGTHEPSNDKVDAGGEEQVEHQLNAGPKCQPLGSRDRDQRNEISEGKDADEAAQPVNQSSLETDQQKKTLQKDESIVNVP
jgi:hypothetical protein